MPTAQRGTSRGVIAVSRGAAKNTASASNRESSALTSASATGVKTAEETIRMILAATALREMQLTTL